MHTLGREIWRGMLNAVGEETPVTVIRNGKVREIPRKDIVTGDIVVLNTSRDLAE